MTDAHTIESQGLKTGFAGYLNAWFVSFLIFQRYGDKQLVLDPVRCLWQHCVLEPGDLVAFSEPLIPDRRAGILGILNSTFEVMDRTYKFMEGIVELKLLAIDLRKFHQFLITPDGEATFVSDSSANQAKYLYQSNPPAGPGLPDLYSDGSPANTLS
jgi:hypothetical protein